MRRWLGILLGGLGQIAMVCGNVCFELREAVDRKPEPSLTPDELERLHAGIVARLAAEQRPAVPVFGTPFVLPPGTICTKWQGTH